LYIVVIFAEGLTIFTFFALLVENVGGPASILLHMKDLNLKF
jgi:hypothetical protein